MSRSVRTFPVDLVVVSGLLLLVNVVLRVPGLQDATIAGARLQALVAIPTLLFVPGYVLVAILFPGKANKGVRHREGRGHPDIWSIDSIDSVERAALSFGMSVALVPLFVLVVSFGWELTQSVLLDAFTTLVLVGVALAAIQRIRHPPKDRYAPPVSKWVADLRNGIFDSSSRFEGATNLALVLAILLSIGAAGYAVATPYQSGPSSTLYLATVNETGAQVASGYPTEFTAGQGQSLLVGVVNDEERSQPYTLVIVLERVRTDATGISVTESQEIDRLHQNVAPESRWTSRHTVTPELVGENLRLHYYLFKGESAPPVPDPSSSYRDVYLWINVTAA